MDFQKKKNPLLGIPSECQTVWIQIMPGFLECIYLHYNWCQCRVGAVKRLPVFHYSVVYIFWFFVITELTLGFLKIYVTGTDEA